MLVLSVLCLLCALTVQASPIPHKGPTISDAGGVAISADGWVGYVFTTLSNADVFAIPLPITASSAPNPLPWYQSSLYADVGYEYIAASVSAQPQLIWLLDNLNAQLVSLDVTDALSPSSVAPSNTTFVYDFGSTNQELVVGMFYQPSSGLLFFSMAHGFNGAAFDQVAYLDPSAAQPVMTLMYVTPFVGVLAALAVSSTHLYMGTTGGYGNAASVLTVRMPSSGLLIPATTLPVDIYTTADPTAKTAVKGDLEFPLAFMLNAAQSILYMTDAGDPTASASDTPKSVYGLSALYSPGPLNFSTLASYTGVNTQVQPSFALSPDQGTIYFAAIGSQNGLYFIAGANSSILPTLPTPPAPESSSSSSAAPPVPSSSSAAAAPTSSSAAAVPSSSSSSSTVAVPSSSSTVAVPSSSSTAAVPSSSSVPAVPSSSSAPAVPSSSSSSSALPLPPSSSSSSSAALPPPASSSSSSAVVPPPLSSSAPALSSSSSTALPASSSAAPVSSSALPASSSALPVSSSALPASSSAVPISSSALPSLSSSSSSAVLPSSSSAVAPSSAPASSSAAASSSSAAVLPSSSSAAAASSTGPALAVGDPLFVGFLRQRYQVHGLDGAVYALISQPSLAINARFVFLQSGRCPVVAGVPLTNCWSHPGSYFGALSVSTAAGDQLEILAGPADVGFAQLRAQQAELQLAVGRSHNGSALSLSRQSSHELTITVGNYRLAVENSDGFVNLVRVEVVSWHRLVVEDRPHGLLGQSWQPKSGRRGSESVLSVSQVAEGDVDEYVIADNALLGTEFVYNRFTQA